MTDASSEEFVNGQKAERERFAEYLAHFEASSRELATKAETDESRIYQTTIANAMQAMRQAIVGEFHWQESWRG
ncbi:MAG: hypothetical protein ABUL56_03020 [Actinomycetota bacterium]